MRSGTRNPTPHRKSKPKTVAPKKSTGKASIRILSPSRGPRTLSHREIEQAIEKVFRDRVETNG